MALLGLCLAGCWGAHASPPPSTQTLTGRVQSGSLPIAGARIDVYVAGVKTAAGARRLIETTSDAHGSFSAPLHCPMPASGALLYVTATGGTAEDAGEGQSGSGQGSGGNDGGGNGAIALLAALGPCNALPKVIMLDELTTVAAGYALDAFLGADPGGVAAGKLGGNPTGLANATATAALLADPTSGLPATSLPPASQCVADAATPDCEALGKLDALADALAACVQSSGAQSVPCLTLLDCATAGAVMNDTGGCTAPLPSELSAGAFAPADTLQAVLSVARHPGAVSMDGLYQLAAQDPTYTDGVASAPPDGTLVLAFSADSLIEPTGLAIDGAGDVWIATYVGGVTELSPTGTALSPAGGYQGGGLQESFGIGIDPSGHVWVSNQESDPAVNHGLGSVTELSADGQMLSGSTGFTSGGIDFPVAVLPDAAGHVWVANFGDSTLTELAADGSALSPASGDAGGGLAFPVSLALDAAGQVWVANQGANRISEFAAEGAALSPATGYAAAGLAVPQGIAVDQSGDLWITNAYGNSVTELDDQGMALSGTRGDSGGGLHSPGGIAIDGAGTVWVANYQGASVSAFAGNAVGGNASGAAASAITPGTPLSPPGGYVSDTLSLPFALAVDASGDLWVTNFGNDSVTEFIGIAAPVRTPAGALPQAP